MSEQPDNQAKSIHTDGRSVIKGNVETGGGDFVGRDKSTNVFGDEVHGDKVGGDKVTIGTIINNLFKGNSEDVRKLRNRQVMLKLVYDIWIKGVLERSLYNQLLIDLDMEQRPEAVERPWGMVLETPDQASRLLPSGTKMIDVFTDLNQSLLILGEPGSGKSTMLLELARDLLTQAEQNPALPMPVLFNLSSWAEKHQPFRQWLVDELSEKYQIPKALAQAWVEHDELLLLLDGLDEVKYEYRDMCVKALNEFQQSRQTLIPLALCSRITEYEALTSKLKLNGAIVLRPLTLQQLDTLLYCADGKLSTVAHLIQYDAELQALVQSPLTFSILCFIYQGKEVAEIESVGDSGTRRQQLFSAYIMRMLQRRGKQIDTLYSRKQTLRWLKWLAARMMQYSQTEFLIERIKPNWAQSASSRRHIVFVAMLMWGPVYGLLSGVSLVLLAGVSLGLLNWRDLIAINYLHDLLILGFWGGAIGLFFGLFVGIIDVITGRWKEIPLPNRGRVLLPRLRSSVYCALFCGLFGGLVAGSISEPMSGLDNGLFCGLLGSIVGGFREIKLIEWRGFSYEQFKVNLASGFVSGLIFGLFLLLLWLSTIQRDGLTFESIKQLILLLVFSLLGGMFSGVIFEPSTNVESLEPIITQIPNQGVKWATKSALIIGPIFILFYELISLPFLWLNHFPLNEGAARIIGGLLGLLGGLTGGMLGGGETVSKYYILRLLLWWQGYAPLNYARFLDYCADRIFLRKVGGGYIFVHRLLMEHFASLTEEDIKRLAGSSDGR